MIILAVRQVRIQEGEYSRRARHGVLRRRITRTVSDEVTLDTGKMLIIPCNISFCYLFSWLHPKRTNGRKYYRCFLRI